MLKELENKNNYKIGILIGPEGGIDSKEIQEYSKKVKEIHEELQANKNNEDESKPMTAEDIKRLEERAKKYKELFLDNGK